MPADAVPPAIQMSQPASVAPLIATAVPATAVMTSSPRATAMAKYARRGPAPRAEEPAHATDRELAEAPRCARGSPQRLERRAGEVLREKVCHAVDESLARRADSRP